jgi:TonB family protein
MASRVATLNIDLHGTDLDSVSVKRDAVALLVALAFHVPFYFMKIDAHKKMTAKDSERLVSIDLLETLKKEEEPAPPPPAPKADSIKDRLMKLVRKEPPPPVPTPTPKPLEPPKLADAPNKIALDPKLDMKKIEPKLQTKEGFKTQADPKLVQEQKLAMNAAPTGIAPLSAKKVGIVEDRAKLKSSKSNFATADKDIADIGGDTGPALAGAVPAPAIQIRTAKQGSVEKFSAAPVQKSDKGRIGGVSVEEVGGPKLGLRDQIIARDAAPSQISTAKTGGAGAVPLATKRDAGKFGGVEGGVAGGAVGGVVGGTGATAINTAPAVQKPRVKKDAFSITGPLKDRAIVNQVVPEYPAWAQAQGIEASVVLECTVDASGTVMPNIIVRRTSGYPKLDETAIKALRNWKFVPLPAEKNENQVGLITFNFSLS